MKGVFHLIKQKCILFDEEFANRKYYTIPRLPQGLIYELRQAILSTLRFGIIKSYIGEQPVELHLQRVVRKCIFVYITYKRTVVTLVRLCICTASPESSLYAVAMRPQNRQTRRHFVQNLISTCSFETECLFSYQPTETSPHIGFDCLYKSLEFDVEKICFLTFTTTSVNPDIPTHIVHFDQRSAFTLEGL